MRGRDAQTVLVTGATGVIGGALVRSLVVNGDRVRVLVRHPRPAKSVLPHVEQCVGDLRDAAAVRRAVAGTDVVFHCGARLHIVDPSPDLLPEYEAVNVTGTRHVAEAVAAEGVPRLVMASSIDVYGPSDGGPAWTEESPTNGTSMYARSKAQGEQVALDTAPASVLRLAAVYGPGMKGNYLRLVQALRRHRFVMVGDGTNRRTLVHIDDAVRALEGVSRAPVAEGRIFNVTDGNTPFLSEIIAHICTHLEREPPKLAIPKPHALYAAAAIEGTARALGRTPPITASTIRKVTEDIAVSNARIERELQLRPCIPPSVGWASLIKAIDPGSVA